MFNRAYLFDLLRNAPFGGTLKTAQVKAIGLILDIGERLGLPVQYIAYIIATAFHETGGRMTGTTESLNYTADALRSKYAPKRISYAEADKYGRTSKQKANQSAIANIIYGGAWGLKNLGNRLAGDGWRFIGRGLVQLTGRRNYQLFGIADTPEKANEIETAVDILVMGMLRGDFTGRKLSHYLSGDSFDAVKARAIVNGTDKASLIAMHYEAILAALNKAKVANAEVTPKVAEEMKDVSKVETADVPAAESPVAKGVYSALGTGLVGTAIAAVTTPWAAVAFVALLAVGGVFLWGHLTGKFEFKR